MTSVLPLLSLFFFRNIINTCSVNPVFRHLDFVHLFYKHSRYCNIHFAWPRINSLPVSMYSHGVWSRGLFGGNCFRKEKVECIDALGYPPTHRFNLWLKDDPIFSPATIFCPGPYSASEIRLVTPWIRSGFWLQLGLRLGLGLWLA